VTPPAATAAPVATEPTASPSPTASPFPIPSPSPAASASPTPAVRGTIVLPVGAVVPEGATWTVAIQAAAIAGAPADTIGEVSSVVADPSATEIPFEVPYDPTVIDEAATYSLHVVIEDAAQLALYASDTPVPVITGGAPTANVAVQLVEASAVASEAASPAPLASIGPAY
jgi:uncharacterized lipoprotein YbaY